MVGNECESCGRWMPGRTDAEVTAAAERTADITLRLVAVTRERDALREQVARVRVLAEQYGKWRGVFQPDLSPTGVARALRAALDQPEEQP